MATARRPKVVTKADETTGSLDIRGDGSFVGDPTPIEITAKDIPLPKNDAMTADERIRAIALRCAVMTDPLMSASKILNIAVRYEHFIKTGVHHDG